MDIHYNAFISYRHHPDDIKVAEEIHRRLERYKVPKAIKKRSGKALRLFRDKEELPVTSSLTDDICRALKNSDYLIVICSPHTKESIWVQREIEIFLQTHTRDQVLTVLAEGEPYDVLPEILIREDVADPVTGAVTRQEYEPLSCDWRMKKSRCIREELPRLAAALFGCGYDELRQRQRQYQMRRMMVLFSTALIASMALAAYFIHTSFRIQKANNDLQAANVQVRESLDQALKNQSKFLASAATERASAGDRLTALALALKALPSQEDPRPYVPEAEYALSSALKSYYIENQVVAQGAFPTDALVKQFIVSDDGQLLVILDERNVVTVWDAKTFQKRSTIDLGTYSVAEIFFTASGNILITTTNQTRDLLCYQSDGTLLWQVPHCRDTAFANNRSQILTIQYFDDLQQYSVLDADSGKPIHSLPYVKQPGLGLPSSFLQLDNDASQPILVRYTTVDTVSVVLLDLQIGEPREVVTASSKVSENNPYLNCAALDIQGNVIVMMGDGSGYYNGTILGMEITSPARSDLTCYDAKTLEVKWQSEIVNHSYSSLITIQAIPGSNRLLIQCGEVLQVHDSATGEMLAQGTPPSIPLCLVVEESNAWGVAQNGTYFSFEYDKNQCLSMTLTDRSLDNAVVQGGCFISVPLERQVVVYRSIKDAEGTDYAATAGAYLSDCYTYGDYIFNANYGTLDMFDAQQKTLLWQKDLGYGWEMLGFSEDGSRLWMNYTLSPYTVMEIRSADGAQTELSIDFTIEDCYTTFESNLFLDQDKLLYILEADGLTQLERMDLNTGKKDLILPLEELQLERSDLSKTTTILLASENYVWILRKETVFVIDLQTGATRQLFSNVGSLTAATWNDDRSQLAIAIGNQLLLASPDGNVSLTIELGDKKGVSAFFYDEEILILCDNGKVERYDRQGNLLTTTALALYESFARSITNSVTASTDVRWWRTDDGNLVLNAFTAGNIIDCTHWQIKAFIPQLFTYVPSTDELVCNSGKLLHAFPRYTTEQQIRKALAALGDYRLTDEQLTYYGLN